MQRGLQPETEIQQDVAGVWVLHGGAWRGFDGGDADEQRHPSMDRWQRLAEYVSVREDWLALKPGNVTFEQAAAVPTSGFIALHNLRDASQVGPGRKVLVNGAGGGVGALALQFAKAHGAHVTAVDCTSKLSMLRSLGADEVIDYTREDFTRRGVRYDLIFDVPGNRRFSAFRRALTPDGEYVPIGHEHFWGGR